MTLPRRHRPAATLAARILGAVAVALASICTSASAQPDDASEQAILEKARQAFFHVETQGTPRDPSDPTQEASRWGKAFAVGPDTLVTALNVVGSETEWQFSRTSRDEITRIVRPLLRTVRLVAPGGGETSDDSLLVLPAPSAAIDAASIVVPGLQLSGYFDLSLCDIVEGKVYNALMSGAADPSAESSLEDLKVIPLVASGYEPASYGPLYVFEPDGQPTYASESWGHAGSPVFDEDGNVVAVIATVTVGAGGTFKVLATPIQPLFPGTNQLLARGPDPSAQSGQLKCSMVDMVDRIHDQVAAHAIWTVSAEIDEGEPTGDILFEYESVADPPNIASIEVRYQFWGTEKESDIEPQRLSLRPWTEDTIVLNAMKKRRFSTSEIVEVGRSLYEPTIFPTNGRIWYVTLIIVPTLTTGEVLENRRKEVDLQWSAFQ